MRSPSANSARRHQVGATFGHVAQPGGQTEGRRDAKGNAACVEEGQVTFTGWVDLEKVVVSTYYISHGPWPKKPLEGEGAGW